MQKLTGTIIDMTFHSEDTNFTVFTIQAEDEPVTCVGTMPELGIGEKVELEGEWVTHSTYGSQFRVSGFVLQIPTTLEDIRQYLASGIIYGVGESTAQRLIDAFGEQTLHVLEHQPELVAGIKGIGKRRAPKICESFLAHKASREIMLQLTHLGVNANQALKLYKHYGSEAPGILSSNPYRMIEDIQGIGFKRADAIAMDIGIAKDSPFRLKSGLSYVLRWAGEGGHDFLPRSELLLYAHQILEADESALEPILQQMLDTQAVVDFEDCIYLPSLYTSELECAQRLVRLLHLGNRIEDAEPELDKAVGDFPIAISGEQRSAVEQAVRLPCSIITGGPGTGKTTIIELAISIFEKRDMSVFLCAPTGRAAKRMSEATGYEASTIHRLLEYSGEGCFLRDEENPIDADVLIIDEMSMVDMDLMHTLMQAIPTATKLIMIGDADQLMSVGSGNVLREMIDSRVIPTTSLTHIYRQGEGSLIVENAHRINHGEAPVFQSGSDFDFVELVHPPELLQKLKQYFVVMKKRVSPEALHRIQVLSPTKKGELGVPALNNTLQQIINPPSAPEVKYGEVTFRVDDKVMQTKNNYRIEWSDMQGNGDTGVFNGDMGVVHQVDHADRELEVLFDGERYVRYPFDELSQLSLAYCMSVHKSQGSEFETVLLLLSGPAPLMTRNLLYTAVTRAKKKLYILGDQRTMLQMIQNNRVSKRYTNLGKFIIQQEEQLHGS